MNNLPLKPLRATLDQWRTLQAVIECGGFAQAAQALCCSQSSISYTLARLQEQLGMALLRIEGRKAVLTEAGAIMLRRSRQLLQQASQLEHFAEQWQQGWEAEIRLLVDTTYPSSWLTQALSAFLPQSRGCQLRLHECPATVIDESLRNGQTHLAISPLLDPENPGFELGRVRLQAVAHPSHPLHRLGRLLSQDDLAMQVHIRVQTGAHPFKPLPGERLNNSWTVSCPGSAIRMACKGLGFAWLPSHLIQHELDSGQLQPLSLAQGGPRYQSFYLYCRSQTPGPATEALIQLLKEYALCTASP